MNKKIEPEDIIKISDTLTVVVDMEAIIYEGDYYIWMGDETVVKQRGLGSTMTNRKTTMNNKIIATIGTERIEGIPMIILEKEWEIAFDANVMKTNKLYYDEALGEAFQKGFQQGFEFPNKLYNTDDVLQALLHYGDFIFNQHKGTFSASDLETAKLNAIKSINKVKQISELELDYETLYEHSLEAKEFVLTPVGQRLKIYDKENNTTRPTKITYK